MRHPMTAVDPFLLLRSLDTMSDLALIYDRQSRRVYANKAAQTLGDSAAAFDSFLSEVFKTRAPVVARQSLQIGANLRCFETVFTPLLGDNGNPQFVIAIARDVTDVRDDSALDDLREDPALRA